MPRRQQRATGLDITRGEDIDNARCALVVGRNSYEADPIEWIALKNAEEARRPDHRHRSEADTRPSALPIYGCDRSPALTPPSAWP